MKTRSSAIRVGVALLTAGGLALGACGTPVYPETPLTPTNATPSNSSSATGFSTPTPASSCDPAPPGFDPVQSYDPLPALTIPATGRLAEIKQRGYLIAGVSSDTLLMGSRNPFTGDIEGFDIDIVRELAAAIFGNRNQVHFVVITAAQRQDVLVDRTVDVVARNMTMNCRRWLDWPIAFSSEYYRSGQKVLVRKNSSATNLDQLARQQARVCAPAGTTSMANLKAYQDDGIVPVAASNHTGCLVLFQQAEVDAITGDDTVLAGLVAQDPYAGFNSEDVEFVRYANRLLDMMRADGRWTAMYDRWLADALGPAPAPPAAVYGRAP